MGNKEFGSGKRSDVWMMPTDELTLVTDPKHPLYDERTTLPVDPGLKALIAKHGVKVPIQVRRNGKREDGTDIIEIVDGRQRYKCVCEINEENGWTGDDQMRIPCRIWVGTSAEATATMVMLNESAIIDEPLVKAKKAQRMIDQNGLTIEEVAFYFKRSVPTVERWLELLNCSDGVQKAIEKEGLTVQAALELKALPREEQDKALDEMRAKGELVGKAAVAKATEKATRGKGKKKQKRCRPYADIEKKRRELLRKPKRTREEEGILKGIIFCQGGNLDDD